MSIHDQPLDDTDCFEDALEFESELEQMAYTVDDEEDIFADPSPSLAEMFEDGRFTPEIRARFDEIYACDCPETQPSGQHHLFTSHRTECPVRIFKVWEHGLCEWSRLLKKFLYYPIAEDDAVINDARPVSTKPPVQNTSLFTNSSYDYGMYSNVASTYVAKCRHEHQKVEFPDGTIIYASSAGQTSKDRVKPDYGCYAYDQFNPRPNMASFIKWADFGLPYAEIRFVAYELRRMVALAKQGFDVEVGCMGGHGRTGTMLACIGTLCGIEPPDAVAWVQKHYCAEAVESDEQEWYVLAFDAFLKGVDAPPKPEKKAKVHPVRNGWCPECLGKITTAGCEGFGCEHAKCRLYNVRHDLPPVLTSDPKAGA